MHILIVLLGVLGAIAFWAWRVRMAREGAREIADAARTIANAPRRLAFRYKSGQNGLALIEDPREAAAIMLMEIALARGEPLTGRQSDIIEAEIRDHFNFSAVDAEDLAAHAAWVVRTAPPAEETMQRLSRLIVSAPQLGPKEVVDLDTMLVAVSEAEGLPTRSQLALLQVYRDMAGLKT